MGDGADSSQKGSAGILLAVKRCPRKFFSALEDEGLFWTERKLAVVQWVFFCCSANAVGRSDAGKGGSGVRGCKWL